jgi:hypothetical protein
MPARTPARRLPATAFQPVLNYIAKKNARARELAAAMQMPCTACRRSLAAHVGSGSRWKGCAK